jgi:hypothetical protein
VLNYCMALEKEGYRVIYLPVDREGLLNLADLETAITDETSVVSLMWANNETGVLFPVESIAEICRSRGVLYHCDWVQAMGRVEIDVQKILKEKLSQDFAKYIILVACNPPLAHRVLEVEPEVGVFLPCNVLVYEEEGKTVVSAMDPEAAMVLVKNERVSEVAKQVRPKMERVLNSL